MTNEPVDERKLDEKTEAERLAALARRKVLSAIAKQKRLAANLRNDLVKHGDPGQWKRYGDLLLASSGSAVRDGDGFLVTDYFDDAAPTIAIKADANKSISEAAESYFRLYAKARNGQRLIHERLAKIEVAIGEADALLQQIDGAVAAEDPEFLRSICEPPRKAPQRREKKLATVFKGARRFTSSDGFDILVGKKAADNDYLTFRIARSLETWMHAADYPGSHVVIRNPNKKEIPDQTLVEAAQLAAFYSGGRKQTKAAVNYTKKKFVNKPKRSAAGIVSLANFKTILVEPKIGNVTRS